MNTKEITSLSVVCGIGLLLTGLGAYFVALGVQTHRWEPVTATIITTKVVRD